MGKRVGLTSETAADKSPVDVDLMHRHVEDIGQGPVDVVRNLLGSVEGQPTRWVPIGDHGMGLSEPVVGTGELPTRAVAGYRVVSHSIDVSELLKHPLLHVRRADVVLPPVVDWFLGVLESLSHVVQRLELLVLHIDEANRFSGRGLVDGSNAGH